MKKLITAMITAGLLLTCHVDAFTQDCGIKTIVPGLTSPLFTGNFYLGITGAWLQASLSDIGLNDVVLTQNNNANRDTFATRFHPDANWSWGINAGYAFPCTAYSLDATYYHLQDESTHYYDTSNGADALSSFFIVNLSFPVGTPSDATETSPIILLDYQLHSRLTLEINQADLAFARQYALACDRVQIKPAVGLRYAKIKQRYYTQLHTILFDAFGLEFPDVPLFVDGSTNGAAKSDFDGIGPLASLDVHYSLWKKIGLCGHFDTALLVGHIDSGNLANFTFQPISEAGEPIGDAVVGSSGCSIPETTRMVTSLTGRLGLDYTLHMCGRSNLVLEFGYQANQYYDAVDLLISRIGTPLLIPQALNSTIHGTQETKSCDFATRGPYLNITWHI